MSKAKRKRTPKAGREALLVELAGSGGYHRLDGVELVRYQFVAVNRQENTDRQEGRPVAAIHEGMVAGEAAGAGRGEV